MSPVRTKGTEGRGRRQRTNIGFATEYLRVKSTKKEDEKQDSIPVCLK